MTEPFPNRLCAKDNIPDRENDLRGIGRPVLPCSSITYSDFEARWKGSGGAERANYGLFLHDLCALIGVPPPNPTTDNPGQDAYVLERAVEFLDGGYNNTDLNRSADLHPGVTSKKSTGRIDLYKRGCFVLETKQGTDSPDQQKAVDRAELGLPPEKRRKGHALRGTAKWEQMR